MTGYAVEFRIPTEHFMSSLTKVSSTTRARHRAWIRRYARGVWRAAIEAGAYGDAGTDEKLWPDDDSHCRATVFMEAPGLSAYGVTMWVYIIPVGRIPDMPAWFVSMMPGPRARSRPSSWTPRPNGSTPTSATRGRSATRSWPASWRRATTLGRTDPQCWATM
ncbi:hypothetical protein ESN35_05540 [Bifidobacterium pullorum subsp. gallinarum]|uniref:Uncharacterized protein n=1 Tax=Bifidobacterium pullorum subsp. gallinarum TaxID=78344 RepID=A0A4P6DYG8_9BIFI|nr:hypothetical protein ESN35_05540 [Bifidobacterium pullorum subsp. gallinarum]